MINLSDKTRAIKALTSSHNSYDTDLIFLEKVAPGYPYISRFKRVNQFNIKHQHEKLIYALLSFKSINEIEQFRLDAVAPLKSEEDLREELEAKIRAEFAEAERLKLDSEKTETESDHDKIEELKEDLEADVREELKSDLESDVRDELKTELENEVREELKEEFHEEIKAELKETLADKSSKKKVRKKSSKK